MAAAMVLSTAGCNRDGGAADQPAREAPPNPPSTEPATPPGEAKAAADKARNEAIKQAQEAKALQAQVKQLVAQHEVTYEEGESPFNVEVDGVIRTLQLPAALRARLVKGDVAIVAVESALHLVSADAAERIHARAPEAIKAWLRKDEDDTPADDDPYAEHVIPDDLVW